MGIDQAIEAEAQAQALCMATPEFRRAYEDFAARRPAPGASGAQGLAPRRTDQSRRDERR